MFETIKTFGALLAIPTALFVFYDRMVRGRPLVSLTARAEDLTARPDRLLIVTNVGKSDIAIREITIRPKIYGTAKGLSIEQIVDAAIGERFRCLIPPGGKTEIKLIAIHQGQSYHEENDHRVLLIIHWRKTSSFWFPQIPVFMFTSTKTIRELMASA